MTQIALVGEAWGAEEERLRTPLVGKSGGLLNTWLSQVGIRRDDCFVTNVFNLRPRPTNDIFNLCGPKDEGIPNMKPLSQGKYIRAEYAPELDRLWSDLRRIRPNLIIALGATAVWALVRGQNSIKKTRGNAYLSHLGIKVLPTYHPAAVMRQWTLRPVVMADLAKAAREAAFPELIRPARTFWIEPTIADLTLFEAEHLQGDPLISTDIETKGDVITEIGFAPSPQVALVVPFFSRRQPDGNYWRTMADEIAAWKFVKRTCETRRLVFQNGNYDMNYLWRYAGIRCFRAEHDTMLLHHSLQPEMEKSLGFLGSIYTSEPSWKFMRDDHSTLKAEDE